MLATFAGVAQPLRIHTSARAPMKVFDSDICASLSHCSRAARSVLVEEYPASHDERLLLVAARVESPIPRRSAVEGSGTAE